MFNVKRTLIVMVVLALALGGLGVLSASASTLAPAHNAIVQTEAKAWLGVAVADTKDGVTVQEVAPGSPAETAKLAVGDIIKSVDDKAINTSDTLVSTIQSYKPGDVVKLSVVTGSETHEVSVTLAERPANLAEPTAPSAPQGHPQFTGVLNFLGLNAELTDAGLQIKSIEQNSPLANSGLQVDDVITAINGEKINSADFPREFMNMLRNTDKPLTITVERDGKSQDIEIKIDWSKFGMQGGMGQTGMATVQPTQLGVHFRTLTPEIAQTDKLPVNEGAQVLEVYADTPAAKAGLQKDDIITAVDGDKVDQEHILSDRLYAYEEGDTVKLSVQRGTETMEISVTLGPRMDGMFTMPGMNGQNMPFFFGQGGMDGQNGGMRGQNHGFHFQMPNGGFHFQFGPGQGQVAPQTEPPATEAAPNNPA